MLLLDMNNNNFPPNLNAFGILEQYCNKSLPNVEQKGRKTLWWNQYLREKMESRKIQQENNSEPLSDFCSRFVVFAWVTWDSSSCPSNILFLHFVNAPDLSPFFFPL